MNDEINSNSGNRITTSADIQKKLGRQPAKVLKNHPPYVIEVYSWMAGLPFRTHNYYAVYTPSGGQLRFVTHFMYELPPGELERRDAKPPAKVVVTPPRDPQEMEKYMPKRARSKGPSEGDRGKTETEESASEKERPAVRPPAASDAPREESSEAAKPEPPPASDEKAAVTPEAGSQPQADVPSPSPPAKPEAAEPTATEPEAAKPAP